MSLTAITELFPTGSVCKLLLPGISVNDDPGVIEAEVDTTHTGLAITDDETGSSTAEGDDKGLDSVEEESGWNADADDVDDDDNESTNTGGAETDAPATDEEEAEEVEEKIVVGAVDGFVAVTAVAGEDDVNDDDTG